MFSNAEIFSLSLNFFLVLFCFHLKTGKIFFSCIICSVRFSCFSCLDIWKYTGYKYNNDDDCINDASLYDYIERFYVLFWLNKFNLKKETPNFQNFSLHHYFSRVLLAAARWFLGNSNLIPTRARRKRKWNGGLFVSIQSDNNIWKIRLNKQKQNKNIRIYEDTRRSKRENLFIRYDHPKTCLSLSKNNIKK